MSTEIVFQLIGGLGFFFFGMKTMSEGLKKIAGDKLKSFLHMVTKHRIYGVLIGTLVTMFIQSSSATTVMVIGFVNAGLLALKQAITVIIGANIGTTFTAWLVSSMSIFKISEYALPAIGLGFTIMTLVKTKRKHWGQVILGFGLLFIGLHYMKEAFGPLKESEYITNVFVTFSAQPLLGVLAGVIFTVLLQSSSATIAIVQVLAFNGVISFESAIPIILGDNIGTTITAQLAAIGANINARRAAMSHTVFNVIGTVYMLVFVYLGWFSQFVNFIIPGEITVTNIMFHIAVAHSVFNVCNMLVFLPFIGLLERVSIWLVPKGEDSVDFGTQYLEKHLLETPTLALEQVHHENVYMLNVAKKGVTHAVASFLENDLRKITKVLDLETVTDNLQSEITQYIVELSQRNLLPHESRSLPVLIHNVNDLERIGDHSQNLAELTRRKIEEKMIFSDVAVKEINLMWDQVRTMFQEAEDALKNNDRDAAKRMLVLEENINTLQNDFKRTHIERLHDRKCQLNSGFIFIEFIDNLEKIGDRLTNIAQSVIGKMEWELIKKDQN
ncbi:MAG: Na/Pi cotransporter family protein [Candidatus Omnitrophica bacterium]|nr:Na/Pi cotransporter family protein [Candidatus Omnitrophota bacterium]